MKVRAAVVSNFFFRSENVIGQGNIRSSFHRKRNSTAAGLLIYLRTAMEVPRRKPSGGCGWSVATMASVPEVARSHRGRGTAPTMAALIDSRLLLLRWAREAAWTQLDNNYQISYGPNVGAGIAIVLATCSCLFASMFRSRQTKH